jgi:sulfonate transport system ATP-binding protein
MVAQETLRRGEVSIRDLSKSFPLNGRPLTVLRGLNLEIRAGECLVIVGASGSGKTTLLRVLAGLENADTGSVDIDGRPIDGVGQERAVIFQEPRLLPWLTVLGNVAFGLQTRGEGRQRAEERARHYISLVGLADFAGAYPRQLSGGMAQRVGIARALTVQPEILLLDEPLARWMR